MPNPPTATPWQIASWSRERGRGSIRSTDGRERVFDASVLDAGDLRVGEPVEVQLDPDDPSRVRAVRPARLPTAPLPYPPRILVEPAGLLAVKLEGETLRIFEDLVFDRLDIATVVDFDTGYLTDHGPVFRALVEAQIDHELDDVVRVSADYPFDWRDQRDLDRLFGSIARTLPGYTAGSPYFFAPAGVAEADAPPPPHLSFSIETTGVQVSGVLPRADWDAWQAAFEHATAHIPMRTD